MLNTLLIAYQNEKGTKALLPSLRELPEIIEIITKRFETIKLSIGVRRHILELELERIKFIAKEYVHTRMQKILSDFNGDVKLLSDSETRLYSAYVDLNKQRGIYINCQSAQYYDEYVGFCCLDNVGNILIDGVPLNMVKGDVFVASLSNIKELLIKGQVMLF
ncbi:hypothetical protein CWI42_120010 [Ordospora colligata]|uniref:DNA replication complex GINS protein SLD5 n=1 Tax=Ordospora colligata OC4 TaxID=1354746 RepID=A0A0B2UIK3_9MICR|nr:uncharacterized protein M896_120010 [Ordospora colligata OC4]KHN68785.1 hypothetical protein M896_120010 [Ordospora colligata OC4]TBU13819.1 hypothetical protein CWI40_120010 [Ordospora colligata]TBU14008.1 hypothetical protein CWI41_120010 [Ordospora colligata]TBU17677.1 hypothetical protein CWI42_120010 [Ordospora colligata]